MIQDYLRKYASTFGLLYGKQKCYDSMGNLVMSSLEEGRYINYLAEDNTWKVCKAGDLLVCVINDTPIHITARGDNVRFDQS